MKTIIQAVCFGEVLWDNFGKEKKIGGAPLNLSIRMNSLGINTSIISQVGNDSLGDKLKFLIKRTRTTTQLISTTDNFPTSEVKVIVNKKGEAKYDITYPCAWDKIKVIKLYQDAVKKSNMLIFGSLASRDEVSRKTLFNLINLSKFNVFDVNLRPPHFSYTTLINLMKKSDFIKFNEEELEIISKKLGSNFNSINDNIMYISKKTKTKMICVSKGENGAILFINNKYYNQNGFKVKVIDTVGSGDSFLATILEGLISKKPYDLILKKACAIGAIVASKKGANPIIKDDEIKKLYAN
jgi:fructokinase